MKIQKLQISLLRNLCRKWDSKLQESLKHEWTTDFSGIPRRKIDTIQYHWNKNAVPIGAITGGVLEDV